jgi:hypothetical protein
MYELEQFYKSLKQKQLQTTFIVLLIVIVSLTTFCILKWCMRRKRQQTHMKNIQNDESRVFCNQIIIAYIYVERF